jgi:hypothetical protein
MYSVCPADCSELLSSLLKLTEDEEDLALIIPGKLSLIRYFSAGMRKARGLQRDVLYLGLPIALVY